MPTSSHRFPTLPLDYGEGKSQIHPPTASATAVPPQSLATPDPNFRTFEDSPEPPSCEDPRAASFQDRLSIGAPCDEDASSFRL